MKPAQNWQPYRPVNWGEFRKALALKVCGIESVKLKNGRPRWLPVLLADLVCSCLHSSQQMVSTLLWVYVVQEI